MNLKEKNILKIIKLIKSLIKKRTKKINKKRTNLIKMLSQIKRIKLKNR